VTFLVAQFTDRFGAADLYSLNLARDKHFLFDLFFTDLVVPDLDFYAPVYLTPFLCGILGQRLTVSKAFVRDGFRGQIQRVLAIFGCGAGPFTG